MTCTAPYACSRSSKCLFNVGWVPSGDRVTVIFCRPGMRSAACSQNIGIEPRTWAYENKDPAGLQKVVSDSTKLATCPSSSIPRALKRVPARRHDSRDIRVKNDGIPLLGAFTGDELCGMVIVLQNPRTAEVRIREASKASRSCGMSRDRNCTSGLIMNEFHKYVSSKLSIWKELEVTGLEEFFVS